MSEFMLPNSMPMREVHFADRSAFNAHFRQVIEESLFCFKVREVAVYDGGKVDSDATTARALGQLDDDIHIGELLDTFSFTDKDTGMGGFHVDLKQADAPASQVNLWLPLRGVTKVDVVPLTEPMRAKVAAGKWTEVETDDGQQFYERGTVRRDMFESALYTATLEPNDGLVFADALAGHSFRTIESPRLSEARVFPAQIITQHTDHLTN